MKAIVLRNKGDAAQLKYEEVETPRINDNEVLVKVKAASVNHLDIWVRMGQFPINYPIIPGCEAAGDVAEIGKNAHGFRKGDKVLVMPGIICHKCEYCLAGNDNLCSNRKSLGVNANGCYAEYVKVPSENLLLMGDKLSYEEAASVPIVFGTAYRILINLAGIKLGETVLINAAGSGVGAAAIQIAKLAGAKVIATAGSDEKTKKAKLLGADFAVNYSKNKDFDKEIMKLTNNNGVDAVIEQVGGNVFLKSLNCLKKGGRIIVFGTTSGNVVSFDIRDFYRKNFIMLGTYGTTHKEVRKAFELVKEGKLKPVIDSAFPLKDAASAHRYMEERRNFGKIILKP